jgi:bacterioferritin
MGKRAQEIVGEKTEQILEDLNAAYAFEWQAAYWFWISARLTKGVAGHEIAELFVKAVPEEMGHAGLLAERILELGGTPVLDPTKLNDVAFAKYVDPPKDQPHSKYLETALVFERAAIDYYKKLADETKDIDPVTWSLAVDLLKAEVDDEEEYENYLGSS